MYKHYSMYIQFEGENSPPNPPKKNNFSKGKSKINRILLKIYSLLPEFLLELNPKTIVNPKRPHKRQTRSTLSPDSVR